MFRRNAMLIATEPGAKTSAMPTAWMMSGIRTTGK